MFVTKIVFVSMLLQFKQHLCKHYTRLVT